MIPTAPHTRLQNHTLPPTEWGSPQTKSFAEGGEHWTALNDTSLLSKSRTATLASHFSNTLAACEGFVMQKVSVPHANNTGSMLTWQQRYIILSPGQGSITMYNIAPGQVVVSRPTTKGKSMNISAITSVNSWVGKNKTRFDIVMASENNPDDEGKGTTLLSLMADTPEDCSRWVSALKMVIAAVQSTVAGGSSSSLNSNEKTRSKTAPTATLSTTTETWTQVKQSVAAKIEQDPSLIGVILYGLPAFFQAVDRGGIGLVSMHEFEQGMTRLGIGLNRASIHDLNITSSRTSGALGALGADTVVAYGDIIEQLTRVAALASNSSDINVSVSASSNNNRSSSGNSQRNQRSKSRGSTPTRPLSTKANTNAKQQKQHQQHPVKSTSAKAPTKSPLRSPKKKGKRNMRRKKGTATTTISSSSSSSSSMNQPPAIVRQHHTANTSTTGTKNTRWMSGTATHQVHLRIPVAKQHQQQYESGNNEDYHTSSAAPSPKKTSKLSNNNNGRRRTTSYARPWATKPKKTKKNNPSSTSFSSSSSSTSTLMDFNRVHLLAPRNTSSTSSNSSNTSQTLSVLSSASSPSNMTKTNKNAKQEAKMLANRKEKQALHSALTAAQQMIAQETRSRQKAEKMLSIEKSNKLLHERKIITEQSDRDEENAKNLDKLHVMYGKQIDKLRTMLEAEGNQLANAREEIADLTLSMPMGDGGGGGGGGGRINGIRGTSTRPQQSTSKAIQGAADLILLERLANVEEDYENAKDQVLLLVEEKKIIHLNMDKIRKENAAMNERMKHAETLVKELRRALALSKEESTILESERQRLMKENVVLTRGKHIKEFAVGGVVGREEIIVLISKMLFFFLSFLLQFLHLPRLSNGKNGSDGIWENERYS